jgi:hypothetical protein
MRGISQASLTCYHLLNFQFSFRVQSLINNGMIPIFARIQPSGCRVTHKAASQTAKELKTIYRDR